MSAPLRWILPNFTLSRWALGSVETGSLKHASLTLGAGVDRDAWGQRVPEAVRVEADAVRARMLGGWYPFQGPLYDSEGKLRVAEGHVMNDMELYNWNWQLQGVSGLG